MRGDQANHIAALQGRVWELEAERDSLRAVVRIALRALTLGYDKRPYSRHAVPCALQVLRGALAEDTAT